MLDIIPYMFDCWAYLVVHLLLLKTIMTNVLKLCHSYYELLIEYEILNVGP